MVPDTTGAVEVADRVWWVGVVRPGDIFQCHAYLIEAGDHSVLVDPGSALTIEETLDRVRQVVPLSSVRWLVCHHSDPDIAGGLATIRKAIPSPDLRVVTEWRAETLLHHYDAGIPFHRIEDHDWTLPLDDDRSLRFVLTPYLHFPGALCSYEDRSGVLFSSDLFGGFTDGDELYARDESYFEAMRPFHEHYMPSREILAAGLHNITRAFSPIRLIAPQHGCLVPEPLVGAMFDQLAELDCGIFLMAREDLDVAHLLQVSSTLRRITDALVMANDLPELAAVAERVLPDVLPVTGLEIYATTQEEGLLRFSAADDFDGTPVAGIAEPDASISLDVPGDGPPARIVIGLANRTTLSAELGEMFARLAPALRVALNRHLEQRRSEQEQDELRDSALHDALTGLYNRHALDELVDARQAYGVLMIDIDHFKAVNDRFGHPAGDEVLRRVAAAVDRDLRERDATIRFGGEELLVLLRGGTREFTATVGERIRTYVGSLEFADIPDLGSVTVSVGASLRRPGQRIEEAIEEADRCLYRAKTGGRDQVRTAWDDAAAL